MGSTENIEFYRSQISLARTEIKNLRQQLSSIKQEFQKETRHLKESLNRLRCGNCADAATTSIPKSSKEQPSSHLTNSIEYQPIGYIETSFSNKSAVPRQPALNNMMGAIVIDSKIFNNPDHAISGLEEFSHLWIIFHFHMTVANASVPAKVAPPRLQGERRGVLSTRSPHRPCPIGLSLVQIDRIEDNKIYFFGVDMVNQTPVLDIKPYIPQYDTPVSRVCDRLDTLHRQPAEGVSHVVDSSGRMPQHISNLNLNPSPTDAGIRLPGAGDNSSANTSPNMDSSSNTQCAGDSPTMNRGEYERGAPDGQERFTPPNTTQQLVQGIEGVRVASWISNPPSPRYRVQFTSDATSRLHELIGDRANSFKNHIENLLCDDPRSNYVRTRYPTHEYTCVLEDLCISCVFDIASGSCTIIAVRNAEEMQQQ